MARRARFVHRRRADRIEKAEEREDWIFVLDLAESMAETIMTQQKSIKTVTWTEQATRVHSLVLFILSNMACTSRVLLETTRLAVVACAGFVLLVTARSGANSFIRLNPKNRSGHSEN